MFEPVLTRSVNGGSQDIYRFDNDYGASVINSHMSYGTELAVIKFSGEDNEQFNITYSTPITDWGSTFPKDAGDALFNRC